MDLVKAEEEQLAAAVIESIESEEKRKHFVAQLETAIKNSLYIPNDFVNRKHIDFVIGRGRNEPKGYMNFPINPKILSRNIVYVDPNKDMESDEKKELHCVDFRKYKICRDQDPSELTDVRFIFDWACFYCSALPHLFDTIINIGRRCQIIVPLTNDENIIPNEIKSVLWSKIFTLAIAEGNYPLFNWSVHSELKNHVNQNRYILIHCYL